VTVHITAMVADAVSDVVSSTSRGGGELPVGQQECPKHIRNPPPL